MQHPDDFVQVQVLETCEEQGILDPDDVVADVLDDKDKVCTRLRLINKIPLVKILKCVCNC